MSRQQSKSIRQLPNAGINQESELASSNQCSDARNVWAPKGRIETRPGYFGVGCITGDTYFKNPVSIDLVDSSGNTSSDLTADSAPVGVKRSASDGDYILFGCSDAVSHSWNFLVDPDDVGDYNAQKVDFKFEYWNGTEWKYLVVNSDKPYLFYVKSETGGSYVQKFSFAPPKDWAAGGDDADGFTFNGTRFYLKCHILSQNTAANLEVGDNSGTTFEEVPIVGLHVAQLQTKRYVGIAQKQGSYAHKIISDTPHFMSWSTDFETDTSEIDFSLPATFADVPQFDEGFMAYNGKCSLYKGKYAGDGSAFSDAEVETSPAFVGDEAPYDKNYIDQLSSWPRASFVSFFAGRLWAAGIKDEPFTVRWSAGIPYHKVWPTLSFEYLMEDDSSQITAIYPLGEHMVIFKQDSIWLMIDSGLNDFGLATFVPKRIVAGVGCVAHGTVQKVRGELVFLSEDGLYAFDGVRARKVTLGIDPRETSSVSDRLSETFRSINKGRRGGAASVNWKLESCYLISFPTEGLSTNSLTICWDYDKDHFWLWDNIDARYWMRDEDGGDLEVIYFGDSDGNIWSLDKDSLTDGGDAISSYFVSQRIGDKDDVKRRVRRISLVGTNTIADVSVEILTDDNDSGTSGTLVFSDDFEAKFGTGVYGTASWVSSRRRKKSIGFREDCQWWQTKISHSTKYERLKVSSMGTSYVELGVR